MTTSINPADYPVHRVLALALVDIMAVHHALHTRSGRTVIAVAGESGSGKSVTALCLARELSAAGRPADVLHQDDYFIRPPAANHAHRAADLASVGPQEVDFELLRAHVAAFRAGARDVIVPRVDYDADLFTEQHREFATVDILVVDGTYVLANVDADLRVFLEATSVDTRKRRLARNRDIDAPIVDEVLALEHPIIAAQRDSADVIIDRDFHVVRATR